MGRVVEVKFRLPVSLADVVSPRSLEDEVKLHA